MGAPHLISRNRPRFAGDRVGIVPHARLAGPMPWVIAIMIALTVMAAAAGLALSNLAGHAAADIAGGLTVQVIEPAPAERDRQVQQALAVLGNDETVRDAVRVPDAELAELLEPWLGPQAAAEAGGVPVPALIDVKLAGPVTAARLEILRARLAAVAPSARLDAQARWLEPVFAAVGSLQWLAIGLIALLGATSAAAVWLAARSALGSNRETIEIVHLLGGTDGQIARIFQRSLGLDALLGGAAGLALGIIAILLLGRQFADLGSGMVAGGGLAALDWALLAAIPVVGVAVAMLTARVTVLAALRRML
jgi:cell division transport system permease protein